MSKASGSKASSSKMFFFGNCLGKEGKRQQECSFLKKRTKKLLFIGIRTNNARRFRERQPIDKSFLVLFFKKEHSCLALLPLACRTWAVTFFEKRTKKLLSLGCRASYGRTLWGRMQMNKSFLVLFFKKERACYRLPS